MEHCQSHKLVINRHPNIFLWAITVWDPDVEGKLMTVGQVRGQILKVDRGDLLPISILVSNLEFVGQGQDSHGHAGLIAVALRLGIRVGEAASRIWAGESAKAVAHATSGPALQQNLLCTLSNDPEGRA